MQGHQIATDELDEYLLPSDEEMDGAVHVDGFLKPVKRRGGARGKYTKEGTKRRDDSDDEEGSDGEDMEREARSESDIQEAQTATRDEQHAESSDE